MQKCQLSVSSPSVCLSVHMKQLHCAADWPLKTFSEVSLDSYSLLNVACDGHFHFLLSSSNVEEIKFCVN
jgi:hypothetical protein